jgi:hypothetical protein
VRPVSRRRSAATTFRATGITAYLSNGGVLERAQEMAARESPRTTKLYDRTKDRLYPRQGGEDQAVRTLRTTLSSSTRRQAGH